MPYINLKVSKDLYEELGMCPNMELMRSKADGGMKFLPLTNVLNHVFGDFKNYVSPLLTSPLFGNRPVTKEVSTEIDPDMISSKPVINTVVLPAENITDGSIKPYQESIGSSMNGQVANIKEEIIAGEHCEVEIHTNQSQNSFNSSEPLDASEGLSLQDVQLSNRCEYLYESPSESSHQEFLLSQSSALVDQVSLGQEVIVSTSSDSGAVMGQNHVMSTSFKSHIEYSDNLNESGAYNMLMRLDSELDLTSECENMSTPRFTPISASLALKKNCEKKGKKPKLSNLINPKYGSSGNKRASTVYPKQCGMCLKFYKSKGSFFAHKKTCGKDNVKYPKSTKKRITLKCPNCSLDFSSALVHEVHVSNCKR